MRPVFVNGRFLTQRVTGVQRYASQLLIALDAHLAAAPPAVSWTLLLPPGAESPPLRWISVCRVPWRGPGGGHGWEQVALPRAVRRGWLISLAGATSAAVDRQACVLHDAAVFDWPQAYTTAFRLWYRWSFRRLARRAALPLTVSAFSRARLAAACGVAPERFTIVPGGSDHLDAVPPDADALARLGLTGQRYVLAVGSLNPTKNLAALVRAWARLGRSDARLVIVGAGHDAVFAAAPLPAVEGVRRLGVVDDSTLASLYRGAAGFICASLYEGFGLPPLEAMRAGCPVAVAEAAALPEICGDAALRFDPRDDVAIAAAIGRLLDDADLALALRERGLDRAARWTWAAAAQALLAALARVQAQDA